MDVTAKRRRDVRDFRRMSDGEQKDGGWSHHGRTSLHGPYGDNVLSSTETSSGGRKRADFPGGNDSGCEAHVIPGTLRPTLWVEATDLRLGTTAADDEYLLDRCVHRRSSD